MRVALHTKLRPGAEAEYDAAHRCVPNELVAAIHAAGVAEWTIWRSGTDLFHLLECDDYEALLAALEPLEINRDWQSKMLPLQAVAHDYSAEGAAATLPAVWQLPNDTKAKN